jgi:hypothetical protein
MTRHLVLLVALVPALATAAGAQTTTLDLTLDEAIRRAVDHNPDLAVARLETGSNRPASARA